MTNATAPTATAAPSPSPLPASPIAVRRSPEPPPADWHFGSLMLWHVAATECGGLFSLGEVLVRRGDEPPLHVHAREDETWYVLEGAVLFQRGHERFTADAGTAVLLPRGIPHGFAVLTPTARILHAYTPGGLEDAFRALSTPATRRELPPAPDGPPDAAALRHAEQVFASRGVTFVGPPLPVVLAAEASGARYALRRAGRKPAQGLAG